MGIDWEEKLLRATIRTARDWAGRYPIMYSVLFGLGTVVLQVAVVAGSLRLGGPIEALIGAVLVPVVLFVFMAVRTLLQMVYEARAHLGEHLDPTRSADVAAANFSCALTGPSQGEIGVVVTNNDAAGDFHAKIVELAGVDTDPGPIHVRWRSDTGCQQRRINRGDSEVLTVVRVRGRQAVDFLQPEVIGTGYARVSAVNGADHDANAAAPENGTDARPATGAGHLYQVDAVLKVFNTRGEAEGHRSHCLRLTFENGDETPSAALIPLDD